MSKKTYTTRPWIAARKDFANGLTLSEIARKRNLKLENIIKAAKEQKWVRKSDIVRTRIKHARQERAEKYQEEKENSKKIDDIAEPEQEKPPSKDSIKDENLIDRVKSRTRHRTKPYEEQGVESGKEIVSTIPRTPPSAKPETPDYVNSDHLLIFRKLRQALREQIGEYRAGSELMTTFAGDRLTELLLAAAESGDYSEVVKHNHAALQAFGQRAKMLQSLTNTALAVVGQEREILGLSKDVDGDGNAEELLDRLQAEYEEKPLPDNVLNYDAKARQLRQEGKLV